MDKPNYYAVIPANVRYDKELSPSEKLLYGEITALSEMEGYCWASNQYFGNLYGKNKTTISEWVSKLQKCGYVMCVYDEKDPKKTVRKIYIVNPPFGKNGIPPSAFSEPHLSGKPETNNTSSNNIKEYISRNTTTSKIRNTNVSSSIDIISEVDSGFADEARRMHLKILKGVENYPFDESKDIVMLWKIHKTYPKVSMYEVLKKWALSKSSVKPIVKGSKPRMEIINWMANEDKFMQLRQNK